MLLAIDCGNTNIVFAISENDKIIKQWRINTNIHRTADEYSVWLIKLLEIEDLDFSSISGCIIASVVPEALLSLKTFNEKFLGLSPFIVGEKNVKLGININIDIPSEAGADRLVNAVSVNKFYKRPSIVIDFGTATTFDVITKNGIYNGGVIAPGVNLSMKSLSSSADQIPIFSIKKQKQIIGKNTIEALRSGFYWGYCGLINNIIQKIEKETNKKYKIIFTGGYANLFKNSIKNIFKIDKNITIDGIIEILKENRKYLIR